MSMSEWDNSISLLRDYATQVPLQDLLRSSCARDFIDRVNELIRSMASKRELLIDMVICSRVYDALEHLDISQDEIQAYVSRYFDDRWFPFDDYFLQVIILIYRPDIGLQIGSGVVQDAIPDLSFDPDGLLSCAEDNISFQKDGVLYRDYYLRYSQEIYRYNLILSGGFLELLTRFIGSNRFTNAGVAIDPEIILERHYYAEYLTRAFIRGPQSISIELLRNPSFPEDKSGTVSEYKRVGDDPLKRLLFEVDKTQVMWSARDNTKTVQIEELVPRDSRMNENAECVWNRYVHAIWDIENECFTHFDGAIKIYRKEDYQDRLDCDIKRYEGRPSYKKLYRLDSEVDLATWCEMTAKYFYENELLGEYFGSESKT